MSVFAIAVFVSVAAAAISIGILMLDDVFAELDRRRENEDFGVDRRRQPRQRHS